MSDLLLKAIKLWDNPDAPQQTNDHNRKQWLKAMERLGDNWLLAKPQKKLDNVPKVDTCRSLSVKMDGIGGQKAHFQPNRKQPK